MSLQSDQFSDITVGKAVHYTQPNGALSKATVTNMHTDKSVLDLHIESDDTIKDA